MKKLTLSLVLAGLATSSLGVYAANPTGAAPFQVIVPNIRSGFDFTLEGLYLQPTNSNLQYVSTTTTTSGTSNTITNTTSLTPEYDFGFAVGAGYVFPNSGNDVRVNWTHFDHSSNDSVLSGQGTTVIEASGDSIPIRLATETVNAASNVSFKYDAVDLDMGQYMSIGTRLQTRLFAGLRYANLENNVSDTYTLLDSAFTNFSQVTGDSFNSKFTGIGPRVGIDTSYHVVDCFGVVAHFATALLVGRVESSTSNMVTTTNARNIEVAATTTTGGVSTTSNQTRVVPAFDAKLGVDYTLGFRHDASHLVIEAGYQVTQYIDAIDRAYNTANVTSGVGFNGPYLSLNFKI